jgi:magnesium transporter
MSRRRRHKLRQFIDLKLAAQKKAAELEAAPEKTTITAVAYGPEKFHETAINQPEEIRQLIGKWPVLWVRVVGVSDAALIHKIGDIFLLHELALEDVMHIHQRAKVETYGDQLFLVLRSVALDQSALVGEQVSFFLGKGFLISFEERPGIAGTGFAAIDDRIRRGSGHLRSEQADYLMYAAIDSIIDGFFPVVEVTGDALELLEDEIVEKIDRYTPARIHELKRDVIGLRRAIWPARDAVNILTRDDTSDLLGNKTRIYMRDCYDHAMRIIDLVETQREMCADLMDLYLSSVSNRMNEVMKILTIVTLVFMPPSLVAAIYGMNFTPIPDYKWNSGFEYAIALMLITASIVWLWAHRRGWFRDDTAMK